MKKVLFVGRGGISRTPMAASLFESMLKKQDSQEEFLVEVAATGHWHIGESPDDEIVELLEEKGCQVKCQPVRQVTEEDLQAFDYLVAMDAEILGTLHQMAGMEETGEILRLLDLAETREEDDIPDPYETGNIESVYDLIYKGCKAFLGYLLKQ
ncbi:low molecular weight protein-tyrosine-phosphatase [Pseudalkalibacillus sp. Hm43]|uniref:arsenate reductase/protein-tyrosine-phosphatase family protein n=1 Tax=Pseudalkalibacillus sp. Hm43 TaxID=3450742 RepID=UPI003F43FD41